MSLFSLLGCSPVSKDLPDSLRDIRIEVTIEDVTERGVESADYHRTSLKVTLHHVAEGAIEREDVRVEVNGVPLEFRVSTGNYYDRHPYYRLPDDAAVQILPNTEYRFTLILPDGTRHGIGTLRTPAALAAAQFDFPPWMPSDRQVAIAWRDVAQPTELIVYRSQRRVEPDGTEVLETGSVNDPAALHRRIASGWWPKRSDRWTIPSAMLEDHPEAALTALGVEITAATKGSVSRSFAPTSFLRAVRRLVLRMDVANADDSS